MFDVVIFGPCPLLIATRIVANKQSDCTIGKMSKRVDAHATLLYRAKGHVLLARHPVRYQKSMSNASFKSEN